MLFILQPFGVSFGGIHLKDFIVFSYFWIKRLIDWGVQQAEHQTNAWRPTMRYHMSLLVSLLAAGLAVMVQPVSAYYITNYYNLESTTITGYVEYIDDQMAYIASDYGDEIAVQLGPESYWREHNYHLSRGDYVEMLVWYDPADRYTDCYFAGEIWGSGYHYRITNDDGVPYWVIFADDYYYSLGYRTSCVSFMMWYDCPPFYFVYLILPPPPPHIYICYYGPHWRTHHRDWHHGPRYCRGGSYWDDGQGYERHGRRSRDHDGNDAVRTGSIASKSNMARSAKASARISTPVTPRVVTPRAETTRKNPWLKSVAPTTKYESKSAATKSTITEQKYQAKTKTQSGTDTAKTGIVRQAKQETAKTQIKPISRTVKAEKSNAGDKRSKASSK